MLAFVVCWVGGSTKQMLFSITISFPFRAATRVRRVPDANGREATNDPSSNCYLLPYYTFLSLCPCYGGEIMNIIL